MSLHRTSMHRMAVLWDVDKGPAIPIGVALEYSDEIRIVVPSRYAMPAYYREPIRVGSLKAPEVEEIYVGYPEYFDHVLEDLSRTFAITGKASVR